MTNKNDCSPGHQPTRERGEGKIQAPESGSGVQVSREPVHDGSTPWQSGERLVGRLDHNGNQMIGVQIQGAPEAAQDIIDREIALKQSLENDKRKEERIDEEIDKRVKTLNQLIVDKRKEERMQICQSIMAYVEDCQEQADKLENSGARERKRLRKTGHLKEAEDTKKMFQARKGAFQVRAAIAADLAYKIDQMWGRNSDGTLEEMPDAKSADLIKDAAQELNREAAHLKTV